MRWRNEKILSDKVLVTSVAVATAKANASSFCLTLSFVVIVISVFYVQCHQNNVSCDCCHRQKYFSVHREDSRKITTKISHRASVAVLENRNVIKIKLRARLDTISNQYHHDSIHTLAARLPTWVSDDKNRWESVVEGNIQKLTQLVRAYLTGNLLTTLRFFQNLFHLQIERRRTINKYLSRQGFVGEARLFFHILKVLMSSV